jgi:hypothetical protein
MGIHRVRAREITHLWRRRIEEDVAWHRVSPSGFTPVTAALLLFQTPNPGAWVTARSRPATLLWTLATMVCYGALLDGGVPEKIDREMLGPLRAHHEYLSPWRGMKP